MHCSLSRREPLYNSLQLGYLCILGQQLVIVQLEDSGVVLQLFLKLCCSFPGGLPGCFLLRCTLQSVLQLML